MAKVVKKVRLQKRKLLKLAKMLLADAKNRKGIKFDINEIGTHSGTEKIVPLNCGTTACAIGLAALSGAYKKDGLSYYVEVGGSIWTKWHNRSMDYDKVAMLLFGVTKEQVHYLFSPWTYPFDKRTGAITEREVVRRIKRVVEGKKIPTDPRSI